METKQIFLGVIGSHLYGCATPESDLDLLSVVVERRSDFFIEGPMKSKQTINTDSGEDATVYGLSHFVRSLTKGSPSVLGVLWHPSPIGVDKVWGMLTVNSHLWVTMHAVQQFLGAAKSQQGRIARKGMDHKNAAAALRYLHEARSLITNRSISYPLDELFVDDYLAIKDGALSNAEILSLLAEEDARTMRLFDGADLPSLPPKQTIGNLLHEMYEAVWNVR